MKSPLRCPLHHNPEMIAAHEKARCRDTGPLPAQMAPASQMRRGVKWTDLLFTVVHDFLCVNRLASVPWVRDILPLSTAYLAARHARIIPRLGEFCIVDALKRVVVVRAADVGFGEFI